MYAKNEKTYSQRGFASLESVKSDSSGKSKLRIRLPRKLFNGKLKYITLGLDDNPKNRKYAEQRVEAINADIINDNFDITLDRYQPQAKKASHLAKIQALQLPNIADLYEKYILVRKKSVSPNTYKQNYLVWLKRLKDKDLPKEYLEISEDNALKLLEYLEPKYTSEMNKRLFDQLNACCRWAIDSHQIKIALNPYDRVKNVIPKEKKKRKNPAHFEIEEINQILDAFAANKYYCHYTNYVAFMFATGARPSEVICLTWNDIDDKHIYFTKAVVISENGRQEREGLKAEDQRKFPINNKIREILEKQKQKHKSPKSDLIFPSPQGKWIDLHNFRNRAWKKIMEGLEIKYKRPYTTRATFITHALESDSQGRKLDAKDVARFCGNNPETIYKNYAGSSNLRNLQAPEIF